MYKTAKMGFAMESELIERLSFQVYAKNQGDR